MWCESILCWHHPVPSNNSRPLWRNIHWSYIAGQLVVTDRLRRAHLPRWKLPRHALDHSIQIDSGWQNTSRKGDMRCSLRPWTQCSSIIIEKGIATWRSPGLQRTNTIGKCTKTQCIGVIWGLLRVKDCSSIKRDQTRSSFTTFHLRCVSRGWWSGSQEKSCTAKRISLQPYRKELYWSRTCIMNARTPQALTRERPSTILACTERIVTVERTSKVVAAK